MPCFFTSRSNFCKLRTYPKLWYVFTMLKRGLKPKLNKLIKFFRYKHSRLIVSMCTVSYVIALISMYTSFPSVWFFFSSTKLRVCELRRDTVHTNERTSTRECSKRIFFHMLCTLSGNWKIMYHVKRLYSGFAIETSFNDKVKWSSKCSN